MADLQPRLLTEDDARVYLAGTNPRSILPPVIQRPQRWDRVALDRRLDELSGIAPIIPHAPAEPTTADDALDRWSAGRASGRP